MRMLSLFPQILFLAPFSAFVIRLALACVFAIMAWRHFSAPENSLRALGALEIAAAAALALGTWTQGVALAGTVRVVLDIVFPRLRVLPLSTMLLALVMLLSLIVTGAGVFFAFDLPL